mgnify:CR=1 FL=1
MIGIFLSGNSSSSCKYSNQPKSFIEYLRESGGYIHPHLQYRIIEIIERLDGAQIANARLNSVDEFWNHPQLKARKRWKKVDTPKGEVLSLIPPVTMDKITPVMNPIPSLGSHTESILVELGFTKDFVKQLYKDGAI